MDLQHDSGHPAKDQDRFDQDPVSKAPLGMSREDWGAFRAEHLSTPEQRAETHAEWLAYEARRKQRWENAGFDIGWPESGVRPEGQRLQNGEAHTNKP
ncbi:MAG: hypothetical protein H6922_04340 [Pseudomonadaceae bacterium]|nr:hypothetical protein [Pseudomonadaceae bacterium]